MSELIILHLLPSTSPMQNCSKNCRTQPTIRDVTCKRFTFISTLIGANLWQATKKKLRKGCGDENTREKRERKRFRSKMELLQCLESKRKR